MNNLFSWSAQILALAVFGAAASLLLRNPKARLYFWQGLLLLSLLLPLVQPWQQPPAVVYSPVSTALPFPQPPANPPAEPSISAVLWLSSHWLEVLAFGAALRLLWLA